MAAERELDARLAAASLPPAPGNPLASDSRTYTAGADNRIASLTEVTVDPAGVTLIDSGSPLLFELGVGEWIVTDAVAASGGTTDSGGASFDVIFVETPHRLRAECRADGFAAWWVTEPLHPLPLADMRMPRRSVTPSETG